MLLAHVVENAKFSPLKERIERFCRIVMNVALGILFFSMVYRGVGRVLTANAYVYMILISHETAILMDKTLNQRRQFTNSIAINRAGSYRAVSLNCNENALFGSSLAPLVL